MAVGGWERAVGGRAWKKVEGIWTDIKPLVGASGLFQGMLKPQVSLVIQPLGHLAGDY